MAGSIVSIDGTLIIQAVNFLIFMVLINKFLFKPLLEMMEERERELSVHYQEVEALKAKAEAMLKEVDVLLAEAKEKAKSTIDEAVKEAKRERDNILTRAHEEASARIETAKQEIWEAFEAEKAKLEKEAEKLAEEIVRKILERAA